MSIKEGSTDDKKQRIVRAAMKVFAKKGFYNSRVSEIAREADVADGTIYLYFKNKDDILISLFEYEMKKMIAYMRKEIEKCDGPLERLQVFAYTHISMITENHDWAEVIQVELRQSAKFMREYVNELYIEYLNLISFAIKEGQEKGIIRKDITPGIIKRAFVGALDEMTRYWVLSTRKKHRISDAIREISDVFIEGIKVEKEK